jgi:hypothetical protein
VKTRDLLIDLVDLAEIQSLLPEGEQRIAALIARWREHWTLGDAVGKSAAAGVLGTSAQALERWIERGELVVRSVTGSSRQYLDLEQVIRVAVNVRRFQAVGERYPLMAALGREGLASEAPTRENARG